MEEVHIAQQAAHVELLGVELPLAVEVAAEVEAAVAVVEAVEVAVVAAAVEAVEAESLVAAFVVFISYT